MVKPKFDGRWRSDVLRGPLRSPFQIRRVHIPYREVHVPEREVRRLVAQKKSAEV